MPVQNLPILTSSETFIFDWTQTFGTSIFIKKEEIVSDSLVT
jgi:hypothetical protein